MGQRDPRGEDRGEGTPLRGWRTPQEGLGLPCLGGWEGSGSPGCRIGSRGGGSLWVGGVQEAPGGCWSLGGLSGVSGGWG